MKKRGQVTIFIILGIVILVAFAIVMSLQGVDKNTVKEDIETSNIKSYIESVLDSVTKNAILKISKQGGEFTPSDYKTFEMDGRNVRVAYGLKDNNNILSRDKVEEELCRAITTNMQSELDLSFAEKRGIKYNILDEKCSAEINTNSVIVDYTMPLNLSRGRASAELKHFQADVNVKLNKALDIGKFLIGRIKSGNFNISERDYSCKRIRACFSDNVIKIMLYEPWENYPGLRFNFAVDSDVNGTCSKLENC